MAVYELSKIISGKSQTNEQVRTISDWFDYSDDYKRITEFKRKGGIWCSCGGTSQSVTMAVYDQLFNGDTLIKTSDTVSCKSQGTGPDDGNYAETTFSDFTAAESTAVLAAWQDKSLTVKRIVTITKFTSSGHGQPTFREGKYDETLTIEYDDTPLTNYKPVIEYFDAFRSTDGKAEEPQSTTVYCKVRINFTDIDGALAAEPTLTLTYSQNGVSVQSEIDVTTAFGMTGSHIGVDVLFKLDEEFASGANFDFQLLLTAGEEVSKPMSDRIIRYGIPFSVGKNNSGFAVGMVSNSVSTFECAYPAVFYDSIGEIKQAKMLDGFETNIDNSAKLSFLKIGKLVFVYGTIKRTVTGKTDICEIPEGFAPLTVFAQFICAGTGSNIARVSVYPKSQSKYTNSHMGLGWYHATNTTTNSTATFSWLRVQGFYVIE